MEKENMKLNRASALLGTLHAKTILCLLPSYSLDLWQKAKPWRESLDIREYTSCSALSGILQFDRTGSKDKSTKGCVISASPQKQNQQKDIYSQWQRGWQVWIYQGLEVKFLAQGTFVFSTDCARPTHIIWSNLFFLGSTVLMLATSTLHGNT